MFDKDVNKSMDNVATYIVDYVRNNNSSIIIFEGADVSGKSTLQRKVSEKLDIEFSKNIINYRPNYVWVKDLVPRNLWWTIGLTVVESADISNITLIDRGMPSSVAYNEIQGMTKIPECAIDVWKSCMKEKNGVVVHCLPTRETIRILKSSRKQESSEIEDTKENFRGIINNKVSSFCEECKVPYLNVQY